MCEHIVLFAIGLEKEPENYNTAVLDGRVTGDVLAGLFSKNEKEEKTPELGKVNCPKNQPRQVNNAVYHIKSQ